MDAELLDYLNIVNKIVISVNTKLSNNVYNRLIRVLKTCRYIVFLSSSSAGKPDKSDFNNNINKIQGDIIKDLTDASLIKTKQKGRKKREKVLTPSDYRGEFSVILNSHVEEMKKLIINWVINTVNKKEGGNFLENLDQLKNFLYKEYLDNTGKLLISDYKLKYYNESLKGVKLHNQNYYDDTLNEFSPNNVAMFNELINTYSSINMNDISNIKKIEKYDLDQPLMKALSDIINNPEIDGERKQIGIEKLCLEYDLNWFEKEMKDSVDARSVMLHDIYKKMDNALNFIIKPYTRYNYLKLTNLYDKCNFISDDNNNDINNKSISVFKSLLVLILLGNKNIISTSFKLIIELLTRSDSHMQMDRTELVFNLGNKLFKFTNYTINNLKIRIAEGKEINAELNKLLQIFNIEKLIEILNSIGEIDKFEIGDSIMKIMEDKTEVITRKLIINNSNNREVFICISDDYIKKLNISCINVTQLPMLHKPNEPDSDGKYLPYIHGEISHIYNTFDTIVKRKYDIRDQVENQSVLIDTINYLNNTPFIINKEILKFIRNEWLNDNSTFFKGLNKLEIINNKDNEEEIGRKQSHNSKYWRYLNTINIATIYQNSIFYLPTFADFRGRIYTLSNYLSYQGDDLSRSLLLFKDKNNESLSNEGYKYLLFYFANLAGHSNLSYEERVNWSENNIMKLYKNYIEDKNKFNSNYLTTLKEPLQFLSIMFAIIKVIKAISKGLSQDQKIIINNPILFDASCNGIQHLSALTRELDMAINTNLVSLPNSKDIPKDFYIFAAKFVQKEIDLSNIENIRKIKINRKFIKKSVMTIPYNISLYGVKEQMKEHFSVYKEQNKKMYKVPKELTHNNECLYLYPSEVSKLGEIVYNGLIDNLPSLKLLNKYLDDLITILLKLNSPIIWITPAGLKISLSNIKFKKERTTSSLIPYGKPVTISIPTNKLNTRKIKTSFMPNLVHSLDASNIHLMCKNLTGIPIYTIHDCFASTCNNMSIIENKVKTSFIEIYFKDGNYLEKMRVQTLNWGPKLKAIIIQLLKRIMNI